MTFQPSPCILMDVVIDIFQGVAAVLVFGCEGAINSPEFIACAKQLPSKDNKVITLSEDSNGDVYMSTGCDSNFEGELIWYPQIFKIIVELLKDIGKSILEFINIPVSIVEFILKAGELLFENMDGVCGYLDAYVQLAEIEATYENSRYILQEVACRPVPELLPGQ